MNTTTSIERPKAPNSSRPSSRPSAPKNPAPLLMAALIAILAAIGVHAYLLNEHFTLRFGQPSANSLCNINEIFSCAAVSASRYSEFLGIPMALWGLLANTVLGLLIGWYLLTSEERTKGARNIVLVAGVIAVTSIVMGAISAFVLAHACPFCIGAYLLSFIALGCAYGALKDRLRGPNFQIKDLAPVILLGAVAFGAAFIMNDQIVSSFTGGQDFGPMVREALDTWKTAPTMNIQPVAALVAGASDANAKMVITEFADYRCSHCKHAAPVLKAFLAANSDVQLRFEAWPLDSECNAGIPSAPNHASCLLARSVNCAEQLHHTGWQAHEYLYEHQDGFGSVDAIKAALPDIAKAAGVTPEQMQACTDSEDAKKTLAKEADVGTALNLNGTPSIYVNGKKLPYGQFLPILTEVHKEITAKN